jgi:NitT/TauT family transport system substrate-binding protein
MGVFAARLARVRFVVAAVLTALPTCTPVSAQTVVKVTLDRRIEGPAAPFLLPLDKGYYRAEGLDVVIDPSAGLIEPITRVASGTYDIGVADINALIRFRDRNPAAPTAVFIVHNKPAYAIIARKSRGIVVPKDLEGKRLGAPAGNLTFTQWPLFAKLNNIDTTKVTVESVAAAVREPMLAAGQIDAATGASFTVYVNLKDRGVPLDDIAVLLMAEHGLVLYGNAIIVNPKFAAEKPQAVTAFLSAFVKGLKETIRDPAHAIESVLARNEGASKDVELERLRMALRDHVITPEVRANGLGTADPVRLEQSIEQIGLTFKYQTRPVAADVFDPAFLPDISERRLR